MPGAPDLRASDAEREQVVLALREHAGEGRLTFTYSHRPAWTFGAAILLFPIGLLALLYTRDERIVLDFDRTPSGGTRLVATGRAPRRVRRAFAELVL